jgi:starch phosphorylase
MNNTPPPADNSENIRIGMSLDTLQRAFLDNLFYSLGRPWESATLQDLYMASALTVRDRLLERWVRSAQTYKKSCARTVCYFSAEFLLGPHLANNLNNLGIFDKAREAAVTLGIDLDAILRQEEEPGLGNGGLGRLAACFMDSMATLQIPAIGYGIRYEFGIFDQKIVDGWQQESSDLWLRNGNPWELPRPKLRFPVKFGGYTERYQGDHGETRVRWIPGWEINGVAYDTPILGFCVANTNLLRLWRAEASKSFDFQAFNSGDYYGAVEAKIHAENISKVLYPNDEPKAGKALRLQQQYFFVSCSLQDMIRLQLETGCSLDTFHEKFAAQLNDTHPALAIVELMRLFVDEHQMPWDTAWDITRKTFAYTNHTLLPEALETWSVALFERMLPRHLEIIYAINSALLDEVRMRFIGDEARVARMSLIDEGAGRRVRMAHLAVAGSHAVNGVAAMHSELVKTRLFRDFHELSPDKFHNVTNGVTPRRFVQLSNPGLDELLRNHVGPSWACNLDKIQVLEQSADDAGFQEQWRAIKHQAKLHLAELITGQTGVVVDPDSLFDIQTKRIHEYKRQHLNLLHILTLYSRIKRDSNYSPTPRTFIFGGKAAPGYYLAKLMIKLIHSVGEVINRDPQVNGFLRVVFYPNFNVKRAQPIYPAADLSEQISLAGKEASGTGNMKFSMNGALTIGTLDGANVEIRKAVGKENFYLFGMTEPEAIELRSSGYHPMDYYHGNAELKEAFDLLDSGLFSHGDRTLFQPLTQELLQQDAFMALADFQSYIERQADVDLDFRDQKTWTRKSILNTARMGYFSSDRAIQDYCDRIWHVPPMPVEL